MLSLGNFVPAFLLSFYSFLILQISDPSWPTHLDYEYSPDFLTNPGWKFENGQFQTIPSACESGPNGNLNFDFIVVGAGPAGSIIANKLVENFPNRTTLLVEAGEGPFVTSVVPGLFFPSNNPQQSFKYQHELQTNFGVAFGRGLTSVGRGLGGGTNHNGMIFVCGNERDYDNWAKETGDQAWNFENMRENIKEMTSADSLAFPQCDNYYGKSGPIALESTESPNKPIMWQAFQQAGYSQREDVNCGEYLGFHASRATIKDEERHDSARIFLAPLLNKKNFMIMRSSTVDKVLFEKLESKSSSPSSSSSSEKKITGIRVRTSNPNCPIFDIKAKREVIISAGAFNSPLILQRSGIGRKQDLNPFNIKQKINVPSGHNYRDHVGALLFLTIPVQLLPPEVPTSDPFADYSNFRNGSLTKLSVYVNNYVSVTNNDLYPDLQWFGVQFDVGQVEGFFRDFMGLEVDKIQGLVSKNQDHVVFALYNVLIVPESSGKVTLRSLDPFDKPKIFGNSLDHPNDVKKLAEGCKEIAKLAETPIFKSLNASLFKFDFPECDKFEYQSDNYWKCYVKYISINLWHPAGTARMGKPNDSKSVVNSRLKVINVDGLPRLRVADASIMPQVISGNTQCPSYAIGWQAAKFIVEENL